MSISAIKKNYGYFLVPAFKITADGTEVTSLCTELVVDQTIGAVSGGCRFTLSGIYNERTRKLSSDIERLKSGMTVKVSVGYGSKLKSVFTGFIGRLEYRFENEVELDVICLDARALMQKSRQTIIHTSKSAEDIANTILDSPIIGSKEVSLPALVEGNIAVDKNDLDFIMDECAKRGKVFFIRDNKAFITDPKGELCITLDWGEYHLSHRIDYLNREYNGIGLALATMECYTKKVVSKQSGAQKNMTAQKFFMPLDPCHSQDSGKSIIDAMAQAESLSAQTGSVKCNGVPDIEVGKTVKLSKFPLESVCGTDTFYISSVRHTITKEFTTEFEIMLGV